MSPPVYRGPFEEVTWPEALTARVVTPGARPRLHGYDCEGDLARNATMAESVLLALTGELPTAARARAFEIATSFLAPVAVNEAPTHAAVVARLCRGPASSVLCTAAVGLAEQARFTVAWLAPSWEWLGSPSGVRPSALAASSDDDRASAGRLREVLREVGFPVQALEHDLGRVPAIVATMIACGLAQPSHVEAAWVMARLPVAFAEAMAEKPGNFREYPVNLPAFHYVEESR